MAGTPDRPDRHAGAHPDARTDDRAGDRPAARGAIREARVTVSRADYDTIGIGHLVERWRAAGLRRSETIACRERGPVVQVALDDPLDVDAHRVTAAVDTVEPARGGAGEHVYVVAIEAPRFPTSLAERADGLFGTCDCAVDPDRLTTSLVGSQPAIADAIAAFRDAGMAPSLDRLGTVAARDQALDSLTARQAEVVETAYRMGYYEVPRRVTAADVAADLGLGQSTVVEHLRRAERNLLADRLPDRPD